MTETSVATPVTVVDGSVRLYYGAADTCVGIAAC